MITGARMPNKRGIRQNRRVTIRTENHFLECHASSIPPNRLKFDALLNRDRSSIKVNARLLARRRKRVQQRFYFYRQNALRRKATGTGRDSGGSGNRFKHTARRSRSFSPGGGESRGIRAPTGFARKSEDFQGCRRNAATSRSPVVLIFRIIPGGIANIGRQPAKAFSTTKKLGQMRYAKRTNNPGQFPSG